jgi:stage V sporulation protein R
LDFFETIFELVDYDQVSQLAAYGGFPVRYPHWRFGMEYEQLSKSYEYGLSKIYEMVINTDPCYAYLMEGNMMMDQKLVMAHVYAHCDFFKNNINFKSTNRKMIEQMANHAARIRRYVDLYGYETVEQFIDVALSLENLIDRSDVTEKNHDVSHSVNAYKKNGKRVDLRHEETTTKGSNKNSENEKQDDRAARQTLGSIFDRYSISLTSDKTQVGPKFEYKEIKLSRPIRDVLSFLIQFAPLEDWQVDVLTIVRDEAYYFAPQGMTKTLNEGWASYWHQLMMTKHLLKDSELIDFADHNSGTLLMTHGYNPYKVGVELFRDIEERWNKGRFGPEWEACTDMREKEKWDKRTNLGRQKIFEVRKNYDDYKFIDEFLTEDFCRKNKLFVYKLNKETNQYEVDSRDFHQVKRQILQQMTNFGQPIIRVRDADFEGRGELLLKHDHEGIDLQSNYISATMKNLYLIWKSPVILETIMDGKEQRFKFDETGYNAIASKNEIHEAPDTSKP